MSFLREIATTLDIDPDEVIKSKRGYKLSKHSKIKCSQECSKAVLALSPEAGMAANIRQLLASRLDNARELLEAADEKIFGLSKDASLSCVSCSNWKKRRKPP